MEMSDKRNTMERTNRYFPEFLQEVTSIIKSVHPKSTVILFGSYARDDAHENSDLDICVLVPTLTQSRIDMKVEIRGHIGNIFYAHDMDFDIKLYTYDEFEREAQYKSTLQHIIKTEGVTLSA